MKFLKVLLVVFTSALFTSCDTTEETFQRLQGHWHSVKYPFRITMDVEDSLVYLDRYSLTCRQSSGVLFDSTGALALPGICGCGLPAEPVWQDFYFDGDTLIYLTKDLVNICITVDTIKLIKSDPKSCKWRHYSSNEELVVATPYALSTKIENVELVRNTLATAILFIGHPKRTEMGINPKIQVRDVFITLKDIPTFISRSHTANDTNEVLSVILAADSTVKKSYMDSVISVIPKSDSIRIFRLVRARESDELGLEEID
jgi:hypothetical protein